MRVAILDIGTRNFAMIVEEISNKSVKILQQGYEKLSSKEKIKECRPHSPKVINLLQEFTVQGRTIFLELYDPNEGEKSGLTNKTRLNIFKFLESHKEILKTCEFVRIEEQFYDPQHGVINKPALFLGESCYAWFLLQKFVNVGYTLSKYKTALMGCPREIYKVDKATGLRIVSKVTKSDRKKWSVETAKEIYKQRNDMKMVDYIDNRKGDDVSDCLLMSIAWVLKEFII